MKSVDLVDKTDELCQTEYENIDKKPAKSERVLISLRNDSCEEM